MSWDMWHTCGYGFETTSVTPEKMMSFIKAHHSSLAKADALLTRRVDSVIIDYEALEGDVDWALDDEIRECTDCYAFSDIVALVLNAENKDIGFASTGRSDEGKEAVIFLPSYPWQYTEKETRLTPSVLDALFRPYIKELYPESEDIAPEYIDYGFIDYVFSG